MADRQNDRLTRLFDVAVHGDGHVEIEATWSVYQAMVAAYRKPDRIKARALKVNLIEPVSKGVPRNSPRSSPSVGRSGSACVRPGQSDGQP